MAKATFACGCFWGVEGRFQQVPGVIDTQVGYTGGHTENPTYNDVCSDNTGHAEAVDVEFDPEQISYQALLNFFFDNHNPTYLNQQGPDVGSQYRSVIFYHDLDQKAQAEKAKMLLDESGAYEDAVVTEIVPAEVFYPAEAHHQKYLEKQGLLACDFVSPAQKKEK